MKLISKKLKIFSTNFVQFGRGIGHIEIELKKIEPQYINNIGNWRPDTQDKCSSDNTPINITEVLEGSSENHKIHCNPRTITKHP